MTTYRDANEILFVRIPCTAEEKQKIAGAAASSDLKKYRWILNALLSAADEEGKKHGTRD